MLRSLFAAALVATLALPGPAAGQAATAPVPELYRELELRLVGPAVTGGRLHDVEALPSDPATIYVAASTGGIWKSTNGGTTWRPVFDDHATSTFGDLAISPSHPDVIWAGTGEQNNRQSTSWGNGVYRSTDAGETWTHLGLEETRHIGRVVVHPEDPDVAWIAAQGNLWKPTPDRGVYRTSDGGRTWEKTLFVDTMTGGTDLVMDACDPDVLYAATYQRLRRAWGFNGGGPGSGIWKSTDGGRSWERIESGLPAGDKGRIGLAAAADRCGVLNAIVEHADASGVYRTEDGGAGWQRMSARNIRPMYYSHIFIDPTDADRVYALATYSGRSEDGGRTWTDVSGRLVYDVGVHSDHHSMWIDPRDPDHYYLAGDGGLYETWDRGATYRKINNLPLAQAYAVGTDMRDPYWLYVGLQDNHSWMGPSATRHWAGILGDDWRQIGFSDGMYHQVDPTSHRYIYSNNEFGGHNRVDGETGDRLDITPRAPLGEPDYRFDWVAPTLLSAHDPRVLYVGGNRLFTSRDRGLTYTRTGDLSRQIDRDTLRLMGVPGRDITLSRNDGAASYGEIVTIAESPLDPAILWVGTDDGNIQLSRDGGESWSNVAGNVDGVPDGTYVSRVIASQQAPGTAYATFDAHRDGDFRPYVFRTTDWGRTWTPLMNGLDGAGSANVIREYPGSPDVLFLGTEHRLFVSADTGASWQPFGANLPTTLYDDLLIHPTGDLVVATHGRSLWILDDASPLAHWNSRVAARPAHLFPVRRATIHQYWKDTSYRGMDFWTGENPPFGAILSYHLARPARDARLIIERDGERIRSLDVDGEPGVIHRVVWDLRYAPLDTARARGDGPELPQPVGPRGPLVSPGTYTVTLVAGDARSSQELQVRGDPEMPMLTDADYRAREAFLLEIRAVQQRVRDALTGGTAVGDARPLRTIHSEARRLEGELEGGSVQPGTLYPPTPAQRERLARLKAALAERLDR
ncbi:MAG: WD40/YVTN/BNR-like repeat-containing protein [Gemmatimonadota bacterium]